MTSTSTLIDYPCEFPIKIMGKDEREFTKSILIIVNHHIPDFDDKSVETRASKKNKYLSLTCTVYVASQSQLDALYQAYSIRDIVLDVV